MSDATFHTTMQDLRRAAYVCVFVDDRLEHMLVICFLLDVALQILTFILETIYTTTFTTRRKMSDATFHTTMQDLRRAESKLSLVFLSMID
jgi:hypothetical protein